MRPAALAIAAATVAMAPQALAHDVPEPRVLVVVIGTSSVEVRLNEMFAGAEAEELRRRFDGDRDGRIDDAEESNLASFLAIRSTANVRVEAGDGVVLPLATESRLLRGARDEAQALSLDVVLRAPLAPPASVTIRDARTDDHAVRVAVISSGVEIESASQGILDAARGRVTGVSLDRDRALTVRVRPAQGRNAATE